MNKDSSRLDGVLPGVVFVGGLVFLALRRR